MRFSFTVEVEAETEEMAVTMVRRLRALSHLKNMAHKIGMPTRIDGGTKEPIVVYADGGARNGIGGWGYLIQFPNGAKTEAYGGSTDATNNSMELTAAIRGLEALLGHVGEPVMLVVDSQYVEMGLTKWSPKWIASGWISSSGNEVANKALWMQLIAIAEQHLLRVRWQKGHEGHAGNERADKLATLGRQAAEANASG